MKNFSFSISQILLKVINEDDRTVAAGDLAGDLNLDFEQLRGLLKCSNSCKTSFWHGEFCTKLRFPEMWLVSHAPLCWVVEGLQEGFVVLGRRYPQSTLRDTSIHFEPFHSSVEFLIETSHLVFFTNEMTGFYKKWLELGERIRFLISCTHGTFRGGLTAVNGKG